MTSETPDSAAARPDCPVFDAHAHAFPDRVAAAAMPKLVAEALWHELHPSFDGTLDGLIRTMDRAGIRRAILCSVATRPEQVPKITDWSAAIASDRIVPFASVHPDCPDVEAQVRRAAEAGLRGLKFHPQYMSCALDDPRTLRVARAAAACGLAVEFHAGYDLAYERDELAAPAQVRRLHEAAPDLRMVACHMGGWNRWDEVLEHVVGLPVYIETSYSLGWCPGDTLRRILDRHPLQYVLFGTDAPWTDPSEELEKFMALGLSADENRAVLWENPHRFLGLEAPAGN